MPSNTFISNFNKLHLAYLLSDKNWGKLSSEARSLYNDQLIRASKTEIDIGLGQSNRMHIELLKWAHRNGYSGSIKGVWLIYGKGDVERIVGMQICSNQDPFEVLVQFNSGPANGYIGICFNYFVGKKKALSLKCPTLEDIDKSSAKTTLVKDCKALVLKQKKDKKINVLKELKDELYFKLASMKPDNLLCHMLDHWIDADIVYPPFVRIIAKNYQEPFIAEVYHFVSDKKAECISNYGIQLKNLKNCIEVVSDNTHIVNICFEFDEDKSDCAIITVS